ncbi:MAG: hypothetical protein AAF614_09510 [Chloroflexota bacterium]
MPTILLAIPFGQTVRDILYTDTFQVLSQEPDVKLVLVSQAADDTEFQHHFSQPNVVIEQLVPYQPSRFDLLLRSFHLATLRQKSSTIRMYSEGSYGGGMRRLAPLATLAEFLIGDEGIRQALGWAALNLAPTNAYADIFARHQPDLVVVTRVLGSSPDFPILKQAAQQNIPVMALVSSWDNFTSKGFFPFGVNWLVVWNEVMRDEAVEMFGFPQEKIFLSGIPRFDTYFNPTIFHSHAGGNPLSPTSKADWNGHNTLPSTSSSKLARSQFFAKMGLDPTKRLITFATATRHLLATPFDPTSPEPEIIGALADAIEADQLECDVQILVRLHPLADAEAYALVAERPFVHLQIPGQQKTAFVDRYFAQSEDQLLCDTLRHSDVLINVASTTTIDAAVFDTPTVCIGFDMRGPRPFLHSCRRFYQYEHYRKLGTTGGFRTAWTFDELIRHTRNYLHTPNLDQNGRCRIIEQQCHYTDGRAGERVGNFILDILGEITHQKLEI